MPAAEKPLIYVVDDDVELRDSLRWLLEAAGYRVAVYATAEYFLASCESVEGACAVLDVRMPGMDGFELQEEMRRRGFAIPVVFVAARPDVRTVIRAFRSGAADFVEKPFDDGEFLARIENAARLNGPAFQDRARRLSAAARFATLTLREREIVEHVVAGESNKAMADTLRISAKTVEAHRARVMEKMRAASIAELVQLVMEARHPAAPMKQA